MDYYRIKVPNGYIAYSGFVTRMPWFPKISANDYVGYFTTNVVLWNDKLNASVTDFVGLAAAFKSKDEEVMTMVRTFCPEAKWVKVTSKKTVYSVGKKTGKRKVKSQESLQWQGGEE